MKNKDKNLYVVVDEFRWDIYTQHISYKNIWKSNLLKKLGGVAEGTAPGWYTFNVRLRGFKLEVSLIETDPPGLF